MTQINDLERIVFHERELKYNADKPKKLINLTLYFTRADINSGAVLRINLEMQIKGVSPETKTILFEEYRHDKGAERRYKEIIRKINSGKYQLDLIEKEPSLRLL